MIKSDRHCKYGYIIYNPSLTVLTPWEKVFFPPVLQKLFIKTLEKKSPSKTPEKKSPTKTPKKKKYFGIILQKSPTINYENNYFYYDYDTQKFNFKLFEKNPYKAQLKQVYPFRSTKIN